MIGGGAGGTGGTGGINKLKALVHIVCPVSRDFFWFPYHACHQGDLME
jgi:hypothetical protein